MMKRLARLLLVTVVAFVALAGARAVTPAGAVTTHTYFGPSGTAVYGYLYHSGFNYPQLNRVYRPLGYYFSIYYTDGNTAWGFKRNYSENPLVWPYAGGYAESACIYSDDVIQGTLYPVTCQYQT